MLFPYENPYWEVVDFLVNLAEIMEGVGVIREVLTIEQLPADINTAENFLKFMKIARQLYWNMIKVPHNGYEAAETLLNLFEENSIAIPPSKIKNVWTEGILDKIFKPSGWASLLGAEIVGLHIMTEGRQKVINFNTNPSVHLHADRSALFGATSAKRHVWDGEATTTSRLSMTIFYGEVWVAGRNDQSELWTTSLRAGVWQKYNVLDRKLADGPGIAECFGDLYITARDKDRNIWFSTFHRNEERWSPMVKIPQLKSSVGLSIAGFRERIYGVFKGEKDS